jgi:hypothetical protein
MDMINEIANLSTAMSTAKVQNEIGIRVLKIAQNTQGQVAMSLLASAVETAAEITKQTGGDAGSNVNVIA